MGELLQPSSRRLHTIMLFCSFLERRCWATAIEHPDPARAPEPRPDCSPLNASRRYATHRWEEFQDQLVPIRTSRLVSPTNGAGSKLEQPWLLAVSRAKRSQNCRNARKLRNDFALVSSDVGIILPPFCGGELASGLGLRARTAGAAYCPAPLRHQGPPQVISVRSRPVPARPRSHRGSARKSRAASRVSFPLADAE